MSEQVFDLASLEDITEAEIQLKRESQPLPIWVTMAGPEHPKRKQFVFAKQRRMRQQLAKTGKVELQDPAEDEADEVDLLATCVLAWRGVVFNGKPLDCNRANVLAVLSDPKRAWFRKALKAAFDDAEAFTVASAAS
ncbi:MAG: hypothetical protein LW768_10280 [Rubrivivax sp.]|jgi:hypothetical protein|nr:hypothetical protein [Rubrivivax sp.]